MNKGFVVLTAIVLLSLFVFSSIALADQSNFDEISKSFWSPDGCGKILTACPEESSLQLQATIKQMISEGKTKEQIMTEVANMYGPQILAEPPKQGFFLSAWIMPFIGLIVGGTIVYLFLGRRKPLVVSAPKEFAQTDIPDSDINEEMKKYL